MFLLITVAVAVKTEAVKVGAVEVGAVEVGQSRLWFPLGNCRRE